MARRRHAGVDQLRSGSWRVRARDPATGRQVSLGVFPTRAEADAVADHAASLLAQRTQRTNTSGPRTVTAWCAHTLDARERDGIRSVATERSVAAKYVERDPIGAEALSGVTRATVVAWLSRVCASRVLRARRGSSSLAATGATISPTTARKALHVLRAVLRSARDAGYLASDPTDGVHVPRRRGVASADAWTWLSAAEVTAVTTCQAYDLEHRTIYATAIYTGLRQGELWALRWGSVALDGAAPEVLVRASHDGSTKTGRVRRVPLLPVLLSVLRAWRATRLDAGPDALVFPAASGGRRGRSDDARWSPQARWTRADGTASPVAGYRLRADVTRRVRFHDLRHTCASHLLQGTWGVTLALAEVRDWLGHSSITMTERYAHLCPDSLSARVARDSGGGGDLSHGEGASSQNPLPVARSEGVEPPTVGSEERGRVTQIRGVTPARDSHVTREALRGLAVAVLREVASRGVVSAESAGALARSAICEGVGGVQALRVLDGGPASAAVALAETVLDATDSLGRAAAR